MRTFQIAGKAVELSPELVRQRLKGVVPESVSVWGVEVSGTVYPVVQALEIASGVPRGATRSARARAVLGDLGFQVTRTASSRAASPTARAPVISPPLSSGPDIAWADMDAQPRRPVPELRPEHIPASPGVYAFYRAGQRMYVGRAIAAGGLRKRLSGMHLLTIADLSWSAFRRNVAELHGIPTSVTRAHAASLTNEQLDLVNTWVRGCEVAWIECRTGDEAADVETKLKAEFRPPLTRR